MVINERAYNNIERMQYLKTSLNGDAARSIVNMEIIDENFSKAWRILTNRYENKRAIRDAHLETLHKLPYVNTEAAHELRSSYNKSKECVELLKGVV